MKIKILPKLCKYTTFITLCNYNAYRFTYVLSVKTFDDIVKTIV